MTWPLTKTFVDTNYVALNTHDAGWVLNTSWGTTQPLIHNNRLRGGNGTTTAVPRYNDAPPSADQEVEANLYIVSQSTTHNAGVAARLSSSQATAYVARYRYNTGVQLLKFVNSTTATTLGTVAGNYAVGATLNLRLQCVGSSIKVFANDVEVISVTDTGITDAGYAGLWILGDSISAGVHITDWSATTISSGDPPQGTVTISAVDPGETTAQVTYSYDDTDQTGFQYRLDGGTAATLGASPATISGLTASTEYDLEVRAINVNGSGTWSAVETFTTDTPAVASITLSALRVAPGWALLASETGITAWIHDVTTGAVVATLTSQSTNASGNMTLASASMVIGTTYRVWFETADGKYFGGKFAAA